MNDRISAIDDIDAATPIDWGGFLYAELWWNAEGCGNMKLVNILIKVTKFKS